MTDNTDPRSGELLKNRAFESLSVVILCAGASSRLGYPKQHVLIDNTTLLERAVELALAFNQNHHSIVRPLVISGPYADQDAKVLDSYPVDHAINTKWQLGMVSSLGLGIQHRQHCSAVCTVLVDQYRVELSTLLAVRDAWAIDINKPAAGQYADTIGAPTIWPAPFFSTLLNTTDTPKAILQSNQPTLATVENAKFDVDTPSDKATTSPHTRLDWKSSVESGFDFATSHFAQQALTGQS